MAGRTFKLAALKMHNVRVDLVGVGTIHERIVTAMKTFSDVRVGDIPREVRATRASVIRLLGEHQWLRLVKHQPISRDISRMPITVCEEIASRLMWIAEVVDRHYFGSLGPAN